MSSKGNQGFASLDLHSYLAQHWKHEADRIEGAVIKQYEQTISPFD